MSNPNNHKCPYPLVVNGTKLCTCDPSWLKPMTAALADDTRIVDQLAQHLRRSLADAREHYHTADDGDRRCWQGAGVLAAGALDLVDKLRGHEREPKLTRCDSCGTPKYEGASCGLCKWGALPEGPAEH